MENIRLEKEYGEYREEYGGKPKKNQYGSLYCNSIYG